MSEQTVTLVVALSGIVTAAIVGITNYLLNWKPNRKIAELDELVKEFFNDNTKTHKDIFNELKRHWSILKCYASERNIAVRIRNVAKSALIYSKCDSTREIIDVFTEEFIVFINEITNIGFENTNKQQIITKISTLKHTTVSLIKKCETREKFEDFLSKNSYLFSDFQSNILEIYEDIVNDKDKRFLVKSEDFIQTTIRKLVQENDTQTKEEL